MRQVHNLKAATLQDSTQAASSTTPLSRKGANEWWASPDNMLSEVPTLQELKIAKTVGLKAITRAVAKMYQLVLFRDSVDIDPKLVLKIVLAFCKQNNKFDADHYDALVADDGKELMLLTNELMATPQGKAYISELAREVRAVPPSLRAAPPLYPVPSILLCDLFPSRLRVPSPLRRGAKKPTQSCTPSSSTSSTTASSHATWPPCTSATRTSSITKRARRTRRRFSPSATPSST